MSTLFFSDFGLDIGDKHNDSDQIILERQVGRQETYESLHSPSATSTIFLHILAGAKISGGIVEIRSCNSKPLPHNWHPEGFRVREALDILVRTDPTYSWNIENGVINLLPSSGEPELLKTRIDSFEAKGISSLEGIASRLLDTPQAKTAMARLKLESGLQIMVGMKPTNPEPSYSIKLTNITLREALNAIARLHKSRAVWRYGEKRCNDKIEYWLDFIVE